MRGPVIFAGEGHGGKRVPSRCSTMILASSPMTTTAKGRCSAERFRDAEVGLEIFFMVFGSL